MVDTALRVLALAGLLLVTAVTLKAAWWTVEPWVRALPGVADRHVVSIDPVELIKNGATQGANSRSMALLLSHNLNEIFLALGRDLSADYEIVNEKLRISFPESAFAPNVQFGPIAGFDLGFEAKAFNIDVIGIGRYVYSQLFTGDVVRATVETVENGTRYFVDIRQPGNAGMPAAPSRFAGNAAGGVNEALGIMACNIAYSYARSSPVFEGLSAPAFCTFVGVLSDFQRFITETANLLRQDQTPSEQRLAVLVTQLENPSLLDASAPVVHSLLASLYKLAGRLDDAIEQLERVLAIAPGNMFALNHLQMWQDERLPTQHGMQVAGDAIVNQNYQQMLQQQALGLVSYGPFRGAILAEDSATPLLVAVLGDEFTSRALPGGPAARAPLVSDTATESPLRHTDMIVNLLAAMVPFPEVELLPISVLDEHGLGTDTEVVRGVSLAVESGAKVVLIPLSIRRESAAIRAAIQYALDQGVIVIAPAGNEIGGTGHLAFPASMEGVIAVGSVQASGALSAFSAGGFAANLFAPGDDVLLVDGVGRLEARSGTSFSAAVLTGIVAAALALRPELTATELTTALANSSSIRVGGGPPVVDAMRFWQAVSQ